VADGTGARGAGPVLVTDFDGTLYRGDAPLMYYARHAARALDSAGRAELLLCVERYLESGVAAAYAAAGPEEAAALRDAVDGWEAVAKLATRVHGLSRAALNDSFLATRAYMAGEDCPLEVPEEYAALLRELRTAGVRVVLATNSPAEGLADLLGRLGVQGLFDHVVPSTGKPAGLARLIAAELGPGAAPLRDPSAVCSVGDHWFNDVAPAAEHGAATGYIDRYGRCDGPSTVTAPAVEGLLPVLRTWAAEQFEAGRDAGRAPV
jgi:FMN phosphatase YigB (HAD superfamily)